MQRELNMVRKWLLCASSEVGTEYFQLPVAGQEEPEYRERVYCYELYHRWRCHWPEGFLFSLSGEVDKQGHPLIRGGEKPDFLVHVPGQMSNLLVVEVKPKSAEPTRMADDLKKLTKFRRDLSLPENGSTGNYYAAYFWLYGLSAREWEAVRGQVLRVSARNEFDPTLVSCFVHERAGRSAVPVAWE